MCEILIRPTRHDRTSVTQSLNTSHKKLKLWITARLKRGNSFSDKPKMWPCVLPPAEVW